MKLEISDWKTVPYAEAWDRQTACFDALVHAKQAGEEYVNRIVLCEHPHVYTLGRSGKETNMLLGEEQLRAIGASLYHIDRGGDITYHGPGQLVCYPILNLEEFSLGLKEYVHLLEEAGVPLKTERGNRVFPQSDHSSDVIRTLELEMKRNGVHIHLYSNVEKVKEKTLSLFGKEYVVKGQLDHLKMDESNPNVTEHYYIIVNSEKTLEKMQEDQANVYGDNASTIYASYSFDCDANEREVIKKLGQNENINDFIWTSKSDQKQGLIELYAGILFIGIFLSFLFIMATILIMYYKQITEGYEDKDRFEIMQKVGLEQQDVKKAIHSQVLTVFFMPLLVAGLHVCFAYPMIEKLLHLLFVSDAWLYIRTTIFCFVAFALVYIVIYVLTSKVYYGIVKRNA